MMLSMNGLAVGKYVPTSTIKTESLNTKYTVEGQIGRGKFAVVKRCVEQVTGEVVAAKFIKKRRRGKSCREEILREVVMLELAMAHPRLVDLREVYETPQEIILITEYCSGGELFHECVIEESFSERDVVRFIIQILEGLNYLHQQSIVHLDLKPQNILLTKPFPEGDVKICDLGFASLVSVGDELRDIIGTADYIAPEVLDYNPLGVQTDMWSLGVLTYVMLTAHSPFAGDSQQETFSNISQVKLDFPADLFSDISQSAQDFMTRLLIKDPQQRLTAAQSLEHPWLTALLLEKEVPPILPSDPPSSDPSSPLSQLSSASQPSPPVPEEKPTSPATAVDGSVAMDTSKEPPAVDIMATSTCSEECTEETKENVPTSPLDVSMSSPKPPSLCLDSRQEEESPSLGTTAGERRMSGCAEECLGMTEPGSTSLRTPSPPDFEKMAQNYREAASWSGGNSGSERGLAGKDVDMDRASKRRSMEVPLKRPKVSETNWTAALSGSGTTEGGYDLTLGAERSYDVLHSPQSEGWRFDPAPGTPPLFTSSLPKCCFPTIADQREREQGEGGDPEGRGMEGVTEMSENSSAKPDLVHDRSHPIE